VLIFWPFMADCVARPAVASQGIDTIDPRHSALVRVAKTRNHYDTGRAFADLSRLITIMV